MTSTFDDFTVARDGDLVTLNITAFMLEHMRLKRKLEEEAPSLESVGALTTSAQVGADYGFMLLAGVMVFFMQAGFSLLEAGTVRFKNY